MTTGPAWVSPALLAAECVSVPQDEASGAGLPPGVHLRVFPSPLIGFPVCPFTVWRAGSATLSADPLPAELPDGSRCFTGTGAQGLLVGAWGGPDRTVTLVDAAGRPGPGCTGRPPFTRRPFVARVPLPGLRYQGPSTDLGLASFRSGPRVEGAVVTPPAWLGAPPVDAIGAALPEGLWWCGADRAYHSADSEARVRRGVPDSAAPPYDPAPEDPVERAAAAARHLEADIGRLWARDAHASPPSLAPLTSLSLSGAGADQKEVTVDADLSLPLWAAATDPAVARWWGFATTLDADPVPLVGRELVGCFAVAALFAIAPTERNALLLRLLPDAADPMEQAFRKALYQAHTAKDLLGKAKELEAGGQRLVSLWTIAVATPPPDPPDPPEVDAVADLTRWNPAQDAAGAPDGTRTVSLTVRNAVAGPLAVRREPGTWLNPVTDDTGPDRQPIIAASAGPGTGAALVTDTDCPAGSARWLVATADPWGRWSDFGCSGDVQQPTRPDPAVPAAALDYAQALAVPADDAPASPGTVTVRATLNAPLAGGAPISSVEAELTGTPSPFILSKLADGLWTADVAAPPTTPGTSLELSCTVTATYQDGTTTSTPAGLTVHDPRPYTSPLRGEVILFSGDRRPDGFAELDLWTDRPAGAPAGTTWRLYTGEEQSPGTAGAAGQPRWQRAERLRDDTAAGQTPMARATEATVTETDGRLRIRCPLPGRLESLRALQLAPVSAAGLEAPRDRRGGCVVAVPLTDAPPAPLLTAALDPDGRTVRLRVSVAFPGDRSAGGGTAPPIARRLGPGGEAAPLVRVRRSAAGGAPAAWPVLATVDMRPEPPDNPADGWRWTGELADTLPPGTPAWAPLRYTCQAAWPAEPTYRPGAEPVAGAFAQTFGAPATVARPGVWSPPSEPRGVAAPQPLPAVVPVYTTHGDGTASLAVTVPATHPAAAPWTLSAATTAAGPADPTGPTPSTPPSIAGAGPELRLDALPGQPPPEQWLVALTTPDGRTLPMVTGTGAAPA
ncbi:hypothetical protein ABT263_27875 [Kitasatospora sp. NPDC001603]|uniref:hypothetical protein n=1 Tax=Kitasatospora sp. NPDC001603 TaxID=3154388 RepID=UPI003331B534